MSLSRPVEPVRAATMAKSAMAPSGTGFFTPLRLLPDAVELDRRRRRIALAFEQRQRADRFARGDLRQPFLLLRLAAGEQDRFGGEIDRRRERHRRQRAAHFLGDHAEFEMARAGAAECFGDRDAEKAHLGEALPQFLVVRRLAVEHRAHRLRRAFLGEKFPRLVAHLLLFVGEIEIHGVYSVGETSVIPGRAKRDPNPVVTRMSGSGLARAASGMTMSSSAHFSTITSSPGCSA